MITDIPAFLFGGAIAAVLRLQFDLSLFWSVTAGIVSYTATALLLRAVLF